MIGVIGGYGDVGSHAAAALHRAGQKLRIGGRSAAAAERFTTERLDGAAEHVVVDARDPGSVREFADGLSVLVNCAGPSYVTGSVAADAALAAGADYVDAAGDDALYALLDAGRYRTADRCAVLSAGLRPGLTGLFPRAVAHRVRSEGLPRIRALCCYTQVVDRFTRVAALEYLQGTGGASGRPSAAWRDGRARAARGGRRTAWDLPFFPGACTLLPQLTPEDERLARKMELERGDWLTVVAGDHVPAAFDQAHALDRETAADALCRASLLDLAGRSPSVTLAVVAEGGDPNDPVRRTGVLHGPGNAALSGAVAAHTALTALRGGIAPGRHFAADVLDPGDLLNALSSARPATATPEEPPPVRIEFLRPDADPFGQDAAFEEGSL